MRLNNSKVSASSATLPAYMTNDAVRPTRDDAHVVRDQNDRHAESGSKVIDEVEDLRLDGDVEGVVGSSAMSSFGSQARAMAIMTRWRSPPKARGGIDRAVRPDEASRPA